MEKIKLGTQDGMAENIDKIAELFPQAVTEIEDTEGKLERAVDFDALRDLLGDVAEGACERYQFTWPGKREAKAEARRPIFKTMRPELAKSKDWDTTENLYIEGDNLDALKILRETYAGKVKLIYIDPPYNTGHDFVYDDDFKQTHEEYDVENGEYDEEGSRLVANTESNGRFHSDWCSMMYSRLLLARDLLDADGIIFISIGDEEICNLRKIADDIFGAANFRNQIIVRRGAKSVQAQFDTWDKLGRDFEYVLMYSKKQDYRFAKQLRKLNIVKPGSWNNHWRGTDRPTMRYPLFGITPPSGQWRWGKERSELAIKNYEQLKADTGQKNPSDEMVEKWISRQKETPDLLRLSASGKPEHYVSATNTTLLNSSWMDLLVGSSSEINSLFDKKIFDTAKLTQLVTRILGFQDDKALVLDFFSGSATTAHAVMQLNSEDGGTRRFILVQLPEVCADDSEAQKAGYSTICDIGEERIRRAGEKIRTEIEKSNRQLRLGEEPKRLPDIGFRVLRIDSSNMKDTLATPEETDQSSLFDYADNVKEDRSDLDLLFEVLPKFRIPYSAKIEERDIAGKKCFVVEDGLLVACFDVSVGVDAIEEIAKMEPIYAVMRDASMTDDATQANFEELFRTYSPDTVRRVI